jgi:hypothetical protein
MITPCNQANLTPHIKSLTPNPRGTSHSEYFSHTATQTQHRKQLNKNSNKTILPRAKRSKTFHPNTSPIANKQAILHPQNQIDTQFPNPILPLPHPAVGWNFSEIDHGNCVKKGPPGQKIRVGQGQKHQQN